MSNNKDFKVKNGIKPTVYNEGVGTVVSGSEAYSLAAASYDSVSFTPSPAINSIGLAFKTDGTKMYTLNLTGASIEQYSLSTAFDITTATKDSKTFSVSSQDSSPYEIEFSSDGTKLFALGTTTDTVYQYSLSTAWDISTASYDSVSFSVASQATQPYGMGFKSDGTALYVLDYNTNNVFQYTLSTAWDVSTLSYSSKSLSVASESTRGYGLGISPDGNKVFVGDDLVDAVFEYTLSTAWDISTGTYSGNSLSVASQGQVATSIRFNGDGTKMITTGFRDDVVYQYSTVQTTATLDLSTGSVFEITPTSDIQISLSNPAASGTVSQATLLLEGAATTTYSWDNLSDDGISLSTGYAGGSGATRFSSDGTKVYIGSLNSEAKIYQYSMSDPYDISTATYDSVLLDISGQDAGSSDFFFKSDGTKLYSVGSVTDTVYQYDLSTAWDLSTASYNGVTASVSQDTIPAYLFFKPDGTKFYVNGKNSYKIHQYSLSTAWDLSTASYDSVSYTYSSTLSYSMSGFIFSSDGTEIWFTSTAAPTTVSAEQVIGYAQLSTAWNLSTIGSRSTFSVSDNTPYGLEFGFDGVKLFFGGDQNDKLYQLSVSAPATITYDTSLQWAGGTAPTAPAIGETDVLTFNTDDGGTTYKAVQSIDGAS